MTRSATEIMQDVLLAAVVDAVVALKDASKGVPNSLLRDIGAIHANARFDDLPPALQAAIQTHVRAAFNRLLKEGYAVAPATTPQRPARPQGASGPRPPHGPGRGQPRRGPGGPGGPARPKGGPGGRRPGGPPKR